MYIDTDILGAMVRSLIVFVYFSLDKNYFYDDLHSCQPWNCYFVL